MESMEGNAGGGAVAGIGSFVALGDSFTEGIGDPRAEAMAPDLVSLAAGGNDILRPGADPDVLAELFDSTVVSLRAAGCRVLVFTGSDPRIFPVIRLLRG